MNETHDNRRSFRINESAYVNYDVISEADVESGLDHLRLSTGGAESAHAELIDIEARLSEACYLLGAEHEQVSRVITLMNDKLNVVIDQLPGLRDTKAALLKTPPLSCEVSADGIAFPAERQLEVGTKLHLRVLLASDNRFFESFGRVVRGTEPPPGNDVEKFPHGIAVEFIGMKPAQREILIQHMFNRESETLRMRRLSLDAET